MIGMGDAPKQPRAVDPKTGDTQVGMGVHLPKVMINRDRARNVIEEPEAPKEEVVSPWTNSAPASEPMGEHEVRPSVESEVPVFGFDEESDDGPVESEEKPTRVPMGSFINKKRLAIFGAAGLAIGAISYGISQPRKPKVSVAKAVATVPVPTAQATQGPENVAQTEESPAPEVAMAPTASASTVPPVTSPAPQPVPTPMAPKTKLPNVSSSVVKPQIMPPKRKERGF